MVVNPFFRVGLSLNVIFLLPDAVLEFKLLSYSKAKALGECLGGPSSGLVQAV